MTEYETCEVVALETQPATAGRRYSQHLFVARATSGTDNAEILRSVEETRDSHDWKLLGVLETMIGELIADGWEMVGEPKLIETMLLDNGRIQFRRRIDELNQDNPMAALELLHETGVVTVDEFVTISERIDDE